MIPTHRTSTHPGEILQEEFLGPLGYSQTAFARHLGIPAQTINRIVLGKLRVTARTAWLLSQALGTTPEFWLNLQTAYDLGEAMKTVHRVEPLEVRGSA